MRNEGLTKTYYADGAIPKYRIVKFGSSDNHCAKATAPNALLLGVNGSIPADAAEDPIDVILDDIATVEYGDTVTRGQWLTSDSAGKAVPAVDQIKKAVISGGSAGNLTVTGIKTTDVLVSVLRFDVASDTGTSASGNKVQAVTDLTSEFTISAADTINNTSGTDTSGDTLLVVYKRTDERIGKAMVSGVAGDYGSVDLL